MINFKADGQKYTSLKLLKKFEEVVTKKLASLKKRLKSEMYSELKMLSLNPKLKRTEKLGMLVDHHKKISDISKDVITKARNEGKISKGLDLLDDAAILETHYNEIISYNSQLNTDRSKDLVFGSTGSGGTGDNRHQPANSFQSLNKATTDFGNI